METPAAIPPAMPGAGLKRRVTSIVRSHLALRKVVPRSRRFEVGAAAVGSLQKSVRPLAQGISYLERLPSEPGTKQLPRGPSHRTAEMAIHRLERVKSNLARWRSIYWGALTGVLAQARPPVNFNSPLGIAGNASAKRRIGFQPVQPTKRPRASHRRPPSRPSCD